MTMFLATVLGWYLVIFSLFVLVRREVIISVMADLFNHRASMFILAMITVILGLMIVASHNIWVMGWPVIVTLFGWLILVGGVVRMVCLDAVMRMGRDMLNHPTRLTAAGIVLLVIGAVLLFHVYFA